MEAGVKEVKENKSQIIRKDGGKFHRPAPYQPLAPGVTQPMIANLHLGNKTRNENNNNRGYNFTPGKL